MQLLAFILINSVAVYIASYILPGVQVDNLQTILIVAIILGALNAFIKPILVILTLPISIITLGLFTFVINAVLVLLVSAVVPGFMVDGWLPAILGAIVLSIASTILSTLVKDFAAKK